jgi:hypothetical protein
MCNQKPCFLINDIEDESVIFTLTLPDTGNGLDLATTQASNTGLTTRNRNVAFADPAKILHKFLPNNTHVVQEISIPPRLHQLTQVVRSAACVFLGKNKLLCAGLFVKSFRPVKQTSFNTLVFPLQKIIA